MSEDLREIAVTDLGEYVDQRCCQRGFRFRLDKGELARSYPFYPTVRSPLNPILSAIGKRREDEVDAALSKKLRYLGPTEGIEGEHTSWAEFLSSLAATTIGNDVYAREIEVSGRIGEFTVTGRMDFVILKWRDGIPHLRIVECKASRKDKTYHRVQLATYKVIVGELLLDGLMIGGRSYRPIELETAVARIDEETNGVQDPMMLPSLGLCEEMDDVRNMLDKGGSLDRIAGRSLDDIPYKLEPKCDSCVFCPICLPDSAIKQRLELLAIDPSIVRILKENQVNTIDDLADLQLMSEVGNALRATIGFNVDLDDLIIRAKARRSTLMNRKAGDFRVMSKRHRNVSQLPAYDNGNGIRLIRIYLDVGYDYIEDRMVSLAAHITDSDKLLLTMHVKQGGDNDYDDPLPKECIKDPSSMGPLRGESVVCCRDTPWSGNMSKDDEAEGRLIRNFFNGIVEAIMRTAGKDEMRPIHFYVWSQRDMVHLIDACSRAGGHLLHNLTELLGCREECQGDLEQLIYTPIRDEVQSSFAFGYTGLSLQMITSMGWFGFPRFHWVRSIEGNDVDLSYTFHRDMFDLSTSIYLNERSEWCRKEDGTARREYFEIRTRFGSDLNTPYWHALWGILPEKETKDPLLKRALTEYKRAGTSVLIRALLECKCQALRWAEERLFKDPAIQKPMIPIRDIYRIEEHFAERYDLAKACQDFLRLDHNVRKIEWLTSSLRSSANRVADGTAIPVTNGKIFRVGNQAIFSGQLDLGPYGLRPDMFISTCDYGVDSFVRISPCTPNINDGQSKWDVINSGVTAMIKRLDSTSVEADIIPTRSQDPLAGRYILPSFASEKDVPFALISDSISDFVNYKVDSWLEDNRTSSVLGWFDPEKPNVPVKNKIPDERSNDLLSLLKELDIAGRRLDDKQMAVCIEGLNNTMQLLLGPPGTGKTSTTTAAVLIRLAAHDKNTIFFVAANTHKAVDELMERVRSTVPLFSELEKKQGIRGRDIAVRRVKGQIEELGYHLSSNDVLTVKNEADKGDVVIGGTTNDLLKLAEKMNSSGLLKGSKFSVDGLIVDEASMMVFADFLALATLVKSDGEIMLAGDHMQLSPITSHDWENETREQIVRLQPHESAYMSVNKLAARCGPGQVVRSTLSTSYRLTPELIRLISEVYRREGVELRSSKVRSVKDRPISDLSDIWTRGGVYLIVHDENESKKSNQFEAGLIRDILSSRPRSRAAPVLGSVSIITPHRAQRSILQNMLKDNFAGEINTIDTVERLQGGECDTIIVSGTQSDMSAISDNAEFILDIHRTNVIFSRAKERLIVVCSENLLNSVPPDIDEYMSSWLWKHLRSVCDYDMVTIRGYDHRVRVKVPSEFWASK